MMKLAIASCIVLLPCLATAQQGSMPGMDMGTPPKRQKPATQSPLPATNRETNNPALAAGEENSTSPASTTQSLQSSEQQQRGQADIKPGQASDAQSLTQPTMTLQEPENPGHRTGTDVPAPELLNDVAKRTPMALEDFLAMAQKNNPTLAQAQSYVRRSEQQGRQAGLYPNPTVGYSGEHIRGGEYGGGEQGAYVQQEIVLGGKLNARRNVYEQEAKVNQIGVDEQQYRVQEGVQQAFYRALTAESLVVVRQRLLKVTLDALDTAHQLANVGQADAPDILQAEVEAEQAKVDFVRAQREYLRQFHLLAAVAGAQHMDVAPLKGDLDKPPMIDAERQVATIVSESPVVKRAEQQVTVAEAQLKDARREAIPNISLKAGEWWSGETIESSHQPAGPMSFVDAGIKLPLWNRNQGNIEAAKADLERAKQDVLRTRLALQQEAAPLAQEYLSSRFEAERYSTELLPRARRAYELYLMKYQQMAVAYPQVLVSQRTLFQLQVDYLHALSSVWSNAVALQNYTLSDALSQPLGSGTRSSTINLPNGGGTE